MEQKNMFKQMIDFNNAAYNNSFNTMVTLQEQMEKATNALLEQATWLPEEGKNTIKGWVGAYNSMFKFFNPQLTAAKQRVDASKMARVGLYLPCAFSKAITPPHYPRPILQTL